MKSQQKKLGQYFTISESLQDFVFQHVKYKKECLLEPSFGAGHLLQKFKEIDMNYPMICCEIDKTIRPVVTFNDYQRVVYGDFMQQTFTQEFKTIIGNPPYVKQKTANLYVRFIQRCVDLLDPNGELLFIVPSDFLKLTSAASVLQTMASQGSFTDFYFPNNEQLFEGASIDVVVFRYEKGIHSRICKVNGEEKQWSITNGIVTIHDKEVQGELVSELFTVSVGLVSGRDEIYKVSFGNLQVLNDKDKFDTYIYAEAYPTGNKEIDEHLQKHKAELLERKIRKFQEKNWFEWGAPRNKKLMELQKGKPCIYVRTMTRKKDVAFLGTVTYFGGTLLCLIPKESVSNSHLEKIVEYLNSSDFQKEYVYAGRFKIGHKQISNVRLPRSEIQNQDLQ